jgi:ABC-type multidrug transport system fused ATPase/permease subunit
MGLQGFISGVNMAKKSILEVYKGVLPFLAPYRFWVILNIALSMAGIAVDLLIPYAFQNLMDIALSKQYDNFFKTYFFLLIFLVTVAVINSFTNSYCSARYITYSMRDIRSCISKHIQQMDVSFFEKYHTGDIISRLNNDTNSIQTLFGNISSLVRQPLLFLFAFVYALTISYKLLLATLILMPLGMYLNNKLSKPLKEFSNKLYSQLAASNSLVHDTFEGIHILKSFNLKHLLIEKYKKSLQNILEWGKKIAVQNIYFIPLVNALYVIPLMTVNLFGGYLMLQNEISLGDYLVFIYIVGYLTGPINSINAIIAGTRTAEGSISRIAEILDYPEEHFGDGDFHENDCETPIEFENVIFAYNEEKTVLNNFSIQIPKGKTIALVGPSGSGKSTVFKLLCGFYKPRQGRIKLLGKDLMEWDLKSARSQIALMSQDTYIFPQSLMENISYGCSGASNEEVVAAAEAANAHDFIMEMPEGYNTLVGERGSRLSGGQKQRIAIARTILKNSKILLLDEPSSALDLQSEKLVNDALEDFMKDRTVFVIAHRLSTIIKADLILVMDSGSIVETGTHEELLKHDGLYKQLYTKQFISGEFACGYGTREVAANG